MKSVRNIDPLLDARWDAFVGSHQHGWLCHHSSWKKLLDQNFPQMTGQYLALFDDNSEIIAALPLVEIRSWLTGHRLVSLPFATLCDPLAANAEDLTLLLDRAVALAGNVGAETIEFRTHYACPLVADQRFDEDRSFKHHFLSLQPETSVLLKSFDRTCVRQRLHRAEKSNLTVSTVDNLQGLNEFYSLYVKSRKHLGLPPHPFALIRSLWEIFSPGRNIEILTASQNHRMIAGILLMKYRDRVSVEYSIHDERYRSVSPVHYLIWEAIRNAKESGFAIFDFGRTAVSNTSLMDYKRHWGTEIVDLPEYHYPRGKVKTAVEKNRSFSYIILKQIVRKSPVAALPAIGKFCYRHLG